MPKSCELLVKKCFYSLNTEQLYYFIFEGRFILLKYVILMYCKKNFDFLEKGLVVEFPMQGPGRG